MFQNLTIKKAHQGLKEKKFSVQELTQFYLKNIEKKDSQIKAFISVFKERALKQAETVDKEIQQNGVKHILTGLPLAIKDNILIKGEKCTAGSKILENYQASYDAGVIEKLKKEQSIFLGKTNCDEFAMGSSTETSFFGPSKNPVNLDYVPGGSSGGSAAAVKGEMCLAALGSDTGGSIRQPASFCGVVGLKPTYGRVSRFGLMAMASSLDQIGPLTKNVEDASILLKSISGKDKRDATSVEKKTSLQVGPVKRFKIGLPKEYFVKELDQRIKKQIKKIVQHLEKKGVQVQEVSLPHTKEALACYYVIMPAEVSANLSRYDGIKYGYSDFKNSQTLLDLYLNTRTQGLGAEVKRRIMLGTYSLSAGYYQAYYQQAQKVRTLIKQDFDQVFKEQKIDCLLTPTTPGPAFKIGEKIDNPLQMYLADIYTVAVNLAGRPALSLPIGEINGLPFGGQIIGDFWQEEKILKLGQTIESLGA
jgi:aspartyl-tRNA(Asn)/glutamyl-tRNA(Gln) amidotransferase subunit A